jgi:eukaryotic-like serine/threonine-protein kinase
MNTTRNRRLLLACAGAFLIFLLAACGSGGTTSGTPTTTGGQTPGVTPTTSGGSAPAPLPATQTSCPAAGTARAAVMTALTLGNHPNIVYTVNEFQGLTPTFGTLKRYDVTNGNKTEIVKLPNAIMNDAQISTDGQWIAFSAGVGGVQKLQLVRVDGQELQTLYCGNSIYNLQWSADQKLIAFVNYQNNASDIYLLNVQDGSLQRVFHPVNSHAKGIDGYRILTWLDATHLYLITQPLDQPADTLSILDITRGPDQDSNALQQVFMVSPSQSAFCWDSDSSYNGSSLFISGCNASDPRAGNNVQGPSSLVVEPATGGSQHSILNSPKMAITSVRAISKTTLLLVVNNQGTNTDTSQNGLWKINTDGTGLTRLAIVGAGVSSVGNMNLNPYTQYPWSNISRDGSMYALQINHTSGQPTTSLVYGSISGGSQTVFADIGAGTQLAIVGWTTL